MNLAEIVNKSLESKLRNNEYPLVKISQTKSKCGSLCVFVNNNAKNTMNLKEFIFFEFSMKIKEATLDTKKPIKLSKKNTFTYAPKCTEVNTMVGIYRIKKLNDSEFLLKLIK